jgi:hypothetical protein
MLTNKSKLVKFNQLNVLFLLLFASQGVRSEEILTPDGFSVTKLYDKFNAKIKNGNAHNEMLKEFNATLATGSKPNKIFEYANKKNTTACNYLGYLFYIGKGVPRDVSKSVKWFSYCAKTNPKAAYNLAVIFSDGADSIKQDKKKAEPFFKKAWNDLKLPQAGIRLAYFYRSEVDWSNEWDIIESLKNAKAPPKHWAYLSAEMILQKHSPYFDKVKAKYDLALATSQFNGSAATLMSMSLQQGVFDSENVKEACYYWDLALKFDKLNGSKDVKNENKFKGILNDHDLSVCHTQSLNFFATNQAPKIMDFKSLLY